MEPRKKKILFIITYLELGGAQRQLLAIIKNLDRERYSLYLLAGDRGYLKDEFVRMPYLNTELMPELCRAIRPLHDITAFFRLYRYIKKERFDIVHTHSPKASFLGRWAARMAGVKNIVYTVHGWPFHDFMHPAAYSLFLLLERLTAMVTKKIIVVSEKDLRTALEKRIAPRHKFVLIRYGVDTGPLEKIYQKRRESPPFKDSIINISSLKRQKDVLSFLDAALLISGRNKRVRFLLIGDGPLRSRVDKEIKKRNLEGRVLMKGWMEDISPVLSEASILMLTSLWEGLPLVLMEAVLAGVPVVTTYTGGCLDIVKDGRDGLVARPKDVKRLAEAALMILDNYKEWHEKIGKNRRSLNLYYWSQERMLNEIGHLYEKS